MNYNLFFNSLAINRKRKLIFIIVAITASFTLPSDLIISTNPLFVAGLFAPATTDCEFHPKFVVKPFKLSVPKMDTALVNENSMVISSYNKIKKLSCKKELIRAKNKSAESTSESKSRPEKKEKKPASIYDDIIYEAANQYNVEPALIKAIIMAESGYNPEAVSHKGAKGLMQLMPTTAKGLGVEDSFNPEHNIYGGVRYFTQLLQQFDGDVRLALAAYNAGSRYVRKYQGVPPFKSTILYITKVFKYYKIYKGELT